MIQNQIPGDFIETGVWRGGACILMRAVLNAYGVKDRRVWVADSFQGVPPPDLKKYPADVDSMYHTFEDLSVSFETVQRNFKKYGLLDHQVVFLKGWFKDTLPTAPMERLAVLRLDGDLYESTMIALQSLYPKLSAGGYVIIDVPSLDDARAYAAAQIRSLPERVRALTPAEPPYPVIESERLATLQARLSRPQPSPP